MLTQDEFKKLMISKKVAIKVALSSPTSEEALMASEIFYLMH